MSLALLTDVLRCSVLERERRGQLRRGEGGGGGGKEEGRVYIPVL